MPSDQEHQPHAPLPAGLDSEVLAGPILRRVKADRLACWLVSVRPLSLRLELYGDDAPAPFLAQDVSGDACRVIAVGERAFIHCIDVALDAAIPLDTLIGYDLRIDDGASAGQGIADWAPHLLYPGQSRPAFVLRRQLEQLLHGSCRRPHHTSGDGMARADSWLAERATDAAARPSLLLLTGDQIYADDVAGPMLRTIHGVMDQLGLYGETLAESRIRDSKELRSDRDTYYGREHLLPETHYNEALTERFFGGVRKPVFSTANACNHTVTLAEVLAMYLLAWSPQPWRLERLPEPDLDDDTRATYRAEQAQIDAFERQVGQAARLMAQVPTYMIFDDHDVTDDWNLSALWEETVYGHPFSRRIVGNALVAYLLCQGWGNTPERLHDLLDSAGDLFGGVEGGLLPRQRQDEFITRLLRFEGWEYVVDTQPKVIVLDTRTRRWRSEVRRRKPSGLMDWEALTEFQQAILHEPAAVIVSPTPVFGVKLIEGIQALFTWFGKPLLVDAENWMAHRGAASVILNILGHARTPQNFVILSGDVHYSFVYDVHLRRRRGGPDIWQITSSGIKNEFPDRLLSLLDRLNRWLYAPWSPLNWFTKRRRMRVSPWYPENRDAGERLWNAAGMGFVQLDREGRPTRIAQLNASGSETDFRREAPVRREAESSGDARRSVHGGGR
ncbi:alkaline phosphatase family protein [Marinobacter sp. JSM 1782161]|uniref:alkaline phosphatase family protein n=1 Tax=Marinobacter sp. JSM 1782161 TaxID=2685906 RepID=UPI001D184B82|nr:alkaline phosphatase family protein [Marinobacter sp. JSM 1782161]